MRACSIETLSGYGLLVNDTLPLLDMPFKVCRNQNEISRRLLSLQAVVALAFGDESRRKLIVDWLNAENLGKALRIKSHHFLKE